MRTPNDAMIQQARMRVTDWFDALGLVSSSGECSVEVAGGGKSGVCSPRGAFASFRDIVIEVDAKRDSGKLSIY